jgi:parallel beta-helix repeat protein
MQAMGPALLTCALAILSARPQDPLPGGPVLVVTQDERLDPTVTYGGLVIAASGVTVDGRGARIAGPVQLAAEAAGVAAATSAFTGTGVRAAGVSDVTLRDLRVQGFELGLLVEDGWGWRIEGCDFSGNFHDPDFGWGEQGEKGGLLLRRVSDSVLAGNRANRTWNAASLVDCADLDVRGNDFSRSSNTCLKLWTVVRSRFEDNDLSWGLRIAPGEIHARDSTCVLIESGSDDNAFRRNDATHGGDGFFIRVLNNWTSRRNVFEGNDASWANNNGFEAWSPENTYVGNVANHCSYGFWLGASDRTVLRGNEAGWNGDPAGFHNAPESFGHGGIVFVNGPSNHTLVDGNWLHHNAGGGLVLRGDEASGGAAWKAWHWVIQRNRFEDNRWGVWMRHAEFIDIGPNAFRGNREGDVFDAGNVSGVVRHAGVAEGEAPRAVVRVAEYVQRPGDDARRTRLRLDAGYGETPPDALLARSAGWGDSPQGGLRFRWGLGDGRYDEASVIRHECQRPGWHRIGVTVTDGALSSLAWGEAACPGDLSDELAATRGPDPARRPSFQWRRQEALDPTAAGWSLAGDGAERATFRWDGAMRGVPGSCVHARIEPDSGNAALLWPATRDAAAPLAGRTHLSFWIRTRNPNIPAWQGSNPILTLHESEDRWLRLTPTRDLLGNPPDVHFRDEWMPLDVPLAGGAGWTAENGPGGPLATLHWLTVGLDTWGAPPLDVWLDGLALR